VKNYNVEKPTTMIFSVEMCWAKIWLGCMGRVPDKIKQWNGIEEKIIYLHSLDLSVG
jgi:hypothetical protein